MHLFKSRWRGALLCAIVLVSLSTLLAGSASAASSLDITNRTSVTLDGDAHWIQQGPIDHDKVTSYGGYQYTSYWDAADGSGNVYLKVTRRRLSDDNLQSITFNSASGKNADPLDYHNSSVLAVSPNDGRLHVEWTAHNGGMNYAISSSGCLSQTTFSSCTFTWQNQTSNTSQESSVTYPMYANDKSGKLYCGFRAGSGTRGDFVLHVYNDNGTWTDLGSILDGTTGNDSYDVDGAAGLDLGWDPAIYRGSYVDAIQFDHNDRLHLSWTWREGVPHITINPYFAQHDIWYAYSDDHGLTWKNNGGTTIGTHSSDPITVADTSAIVESIPLGWSRVNGARLTIDRDNQPHLIAPYSDTYNLDPSLENLRETHFWRTTDGTWHAQYVEPSNMGRDGDVAEGSLMFDRANNAYYIYAKNETDWYPWNDEFCPTCGYNGTLPGDHFTVQSDGTDTYLQVIPTTTALVIDTLNRVNIPIGTGSTANRNIVIRIKNTTSATDGRFYFTTDADETWTTAKHLDFTDPNDGAWHTITIPITSLSSWTGTLHSLELYPAQSENATGNVKVDYIHVQTDTGTVAKAWEFNKADTLYSAESSGSDDWSTWTITDIAPGAPIDYYDASGFGIDPRRYDTDGKINFTVLEQGAPGTEIEKTYQYSIIGDSTAKQWGFGADTIGWTAAKDISSFAWASDSSRGTLSGTITNNDSQIQSANNLDTPIGTGSTLSIRMKNSTATGQTMSICWAVDGQQTYSSPSRCAQGISVIADNAYHIYNISTSAWGSWSGHNLTRLRIDPSDGSAITSGTFNIDYVRILD